MDERFCLRRRTAGPRNVNTFMIEVTVPAIARMQTVCEKSNKPYIRFAVKGGGCAGFNYILDTVDTKDEDDMEFNFGPVKVLVHPKCELFLMGTKIDYKDELMGSYFTYDNPNAKSSCGCGTSFSA